MPSTGAAQETVIFVRGTWKEAGVPSGFTGKIVWDPLATKEKWKCRTEWYKNGQCHRDGDLPAVVWKDGQEEWYQRGLRHRLLGPAIIPSKKAARRGELPQYWIEDHVQLEKEVWERESLRLLAEQSAERAVASLMSKEVEGKTRRLRRRRISPLAS